MDDGSILGKGVKVLLVVMLLVFLVPKLALDQINAQRRAEREAKQQAREEFERRATEICPECDGEKSHQRKLAQEFQGGQLVTYYENSTCKTCQGYGKVIPAGE